MLKSRKQQQKGQGQQSRQKQLRRPAQHRHHRPGGAQNGRRGDSPSGNSCGEARLLSGAAALGSEWGVPISRIFWASTFFSFLHSLLSISWPAAPSLALGIGKAAFLFLRYTRMTPGLVLVGVPAASGVSSRSQLDLGLPGHLSSGWLIKPRDILSVRLPGTKQDRNFQSWWG